MDNTEVTVIALANDASSPDDAILAASYFTAGSGTVVHRPADGLLESAGFNSDHTVANSVSLSGGAPFPELIIGCCGLFLMAALLRRFDHQ